MPKTRTVIVNQALNELFARYKIATGFNANGLTRLKEGSNMVVQEGCRIEPYAWFRAGNMFCSMGAFSYSVSPVSRLFNIGRYVSIATGLFVMDHYDIHPYSRFTNSGITYSSTFTIFKNAIKELSEPDSVPINFVPLPEPAPITINHDVWIGRDVTLKPGITIGTGAIIGAKALVTHDIPPYSIWGGVPARLIKMRFEDKVIERLLQSRWWEYAYPRFAGLNILDPMEFCDGLEELKAKGLKKFEPEPLLFDEIVMCYNAYVARTGKTCRKVSVIEKYIGQDWAKANLLSLYSNYIISKCTYSLPLPILSASASFIQFPLSSDKSIHYEVLFSGNGVKLAVHFEGKWREHAACMSDLLKQNLPVKLTDNRASPLGEVYCFVNSRENFNLITDTACAFIAETQPYLKAKLPKLTKDNYLNDNYKLNPAVAALQQLKEANASLLALKKNYETLKKDSNAKLQALAKSFEVLKKESDARLQGLQKNYETLKKDSNARLQTWQKNYDTLKKANKRLKQSQAALDSRLDRLDASLRTYRKARKLFRHPYLYFRDMFIKKTR